MHKKFEVIQTNIKGACQLCGKAASRNSKGGLPLARKVVIINCASCTSNFQALFVKPNVDVKKSDLC